MRRRETRAEGRFRGRWRRGIAVGAFVGLAAGTVAGLLIGVIAFEPGGTGFWMAAVGAAIFGLGVGAFVGGLSRLESPQPGREPSEVDRPIRDEPALTKEEHPSPGLTPDERG
jgi:hypothetical protein